MLKRFEECAILFDLGDIANLPRLLDEVMAAFAGGDTKGAGS